MIRQKTQPTEHKYPLDRELNFLCIILPLLHPAGQAAEQTRRVRTGAAHLAGGRVRHMHQCARHHADVAVRPSGRVSPLLREDHPVGGGAATVAAALRHLSGAHHPSDVQLGHVAPAGVGQQLLDGHREELDGTGHFAQFVQHGRSRGVAGRCGRRCERCEWRHWWRTGGPVDQPVFDEFRIVFCVG